jgi:hypothetical protein
MMAETAEQGKRFCGAKVECQGGLMANPKRLFFL